MNLPRSFSLFLLSESSKHNAVWTVAPPDEESSVHGLKVFRASAFAVRFQEDLPSHPASPISCSDLTCPNPQNYICLHPFHLLHSSCCELIHSFHLLFYFIRFLSSRAGPRHLAVYLTLTRSLPRAKDNFDS